MENARLHLFSSNPFLGFLGFTFPQHVAWAQNVAGHIEVTVVSASHLSAPPRVGDLKFPPHGPAGPGAGAALLGGACVLARTAQGRHLSLVFF